MAETVTEIAARIDTHLRTFEKDPKTNVRHKKYGTQRFFNARAIRAGRYISIMYVSYQGDLSLTKAQAEQYLAWLDAGNVGTHYEAQK